MNSVHEQCPKCDSGTVPSPKTGSKLGHVYSAPTWPSQRAQVELKPPSRPCRSAVPCEPSAPLVRPCRAPVPHAPRLCTPQPAPLRVLPSARSPRSRAPPGGPACSSAHLRAQLLASCSCLALSSAIGTKILIHFFSILDQFVQKFLNFLFSH